MKKLVIPLLIVLLMISSLGAQEKKNKIESICPKTLMNEKCLTCHIVPSFRIKEERPNSHLTYPAGVKIRGDKGYYVLGTIEGNTAENIDEFFDYLEGHKIKHAIIDVFSPGGSLFHAWRIKGLINEFQERGNIVETRLRGIAASAGAILFIAGNKGHRIANPQGELMFHELYSVKFFDISTPSDKEEEGRVLRHLQDTISAWMATRGKLSKDELDQKMKRKEFWLTGQDAFEFGFVDRLIHGK